MDACTLGGGEGARPAASERPDRCDVRGALWFDHRDHVRGAGVPANAALRSNRLIDLTISFHEATYRLP